MDTYVSLYAAHEAGDDVEGVELRVGVGVLQREEGLIQEQAAEEVRAPEVADERAHRDDLNVQREIQDHVVGCATDDVEQVQLEGDLAAAVEYGDVAV